MMSAATSAAAHPTASRNEIARRRKDEFVVAVVTVVVVVVVVVGVEQGIILAIILSLLLHVRRHYAPNDVVLTWDANGHVRTARPRPGTRTQLGLTVYCFGAGIFYANAQHLSDEMLALATGDDPVHRLVLDASNIDDIDFTGGKTLGALADELGKRGVVLVLADVRDTVRHEVDRYGVSAQLGERRIFETVQAALAAYAAEHPGRG
jgi:MFS superfamily sulfate permease-like transporter